MPTRLLLHLDADGLVAWRWRHGRLHREAAFPPAPTGIAAFGAWLPQQDGEACALLADVAEESFLAESIPFVRGRDRRALLQRKLSQAFHGPSLALYRSLGREAAGRRDEHMLFLGLTDGGFFEPWLGALRASRVPLRGLYTTAQMADRLARGLKSAPPRFLLVNLGQAGIRVSFFDAGRLRFSHLKPATSEVAGVLAEECAAEAARICDYLHGQRLAPRDIPLPCLLLAHPEHHGVFASRCGNTPELEFRLLDLSAIGRHLGLANAGEDSAADLLWLHLLARHPPREQFAPDLDRHFYHLRQIRLALTGGAAALCMAGLAYAGLETWQGAGLAAETTRHRQEASALEARYRARMATLPPLPLPAETLRAVATRYARLEQGSAQPAELFHAVSRALDRFSQVALERLDWSLAGDEPGQAGAGAAYATATLTGSLPPEPDNGAQTVEDFANVLRQDAALSVSTANPQDGGGARPLRGGSDDQGGTATRFELRVSRRLKARP